jgi:alpha-amylase
MRGVCLYFQIHQPYRLRRYSVFDTDPFYFDDLKNAEICRKVATKCYLPATRLILGLLRKLDGRFRVSYSISGVALEQFEQYVPEVLDLFREVAQTGLVDFLSETYHHSLASLYSPAEFREQVQMHSATVKRLLGVEPVKVFRNTELIYSNDLARHVSELGYDVVLTEGADHVLGARSPGVVYAPPQLPNVRLLLKNYKLSDDIAFRFSNRAWSHWPLTADKFAGFVRDGVAEGESCNLFMDYETFGEHQWLDTGIFEFLGALPEAILAGGAMEFVTPLQRAAQVSGTLPELDIPHAISWADTERDLSAWLGNAMQSNALHELYKLERPLVALGDTVLLNDWRRLQSSDHFYYMCTKYFADGDVHKYFSPYESPYDSYINFMNVLDNINTRLRQP